MSLRLTSVMQDERSPLWHNEFGEPFYLPFGAAPDDDDDDTGGDDDDEGGDDDSGSEDQEKDKGKDDDEDGRTELDKVRARMKAADKRAAAAEKALKDIDDKTKSEAQLAKDRAEAAEKERDEAREALKQTRIQNAFLASNDIQWHNPDRALSLADLSEVEIDEDGNVDKKALKQALIALSKSDSYLVKSSSSGDDDKDEDEQRGTGTPTGSARKGKGKGKYDPADLQKRFPALASR